jgi:hypothetical protein
VSQHELVEAYRQGEIGSVTFVRRLIKAGVSAGAALGLALTVPAAAKADACVAPCGDPAPPGANAVLGASETVGNVPVSVVEHGNPPPHALASIATNTANAAAHLVEVATPGNQP